MYSFLACKPVRYSEVNFAVCVASYNLGPIAARSYVLVTPRVSDGCNSFDIVCLSVCVCVSVCYHSHWRTDKHTHLIFGMQVK